MPATEMPAAEVDIDVDLVRRLVASQFPEWSALRLEPVVSIGWDNAIYRLGDELAVRLPRRQIAADLVEKEHHWLPQLAPGLPLPVPVPLGKGVPDQGYPWRWTVCPWLPGAMAAVEPDVDLFEVAISLGRFVAALHRPGPVDGPRTTFRGVPLAERADRTEEAFDRLHDVVEVAALRELWEEALRVPEWTGPDVWLHGDLHPANLLVDDRRLAAVIDFGDLVVGDPATDLITGWMLLSPEARRLFREATGVDDATWARGRGWAVALSAVCLANSADNPVITSVGRRGVEALLDEARDG